MSLERVIAQQQETIDHLTRQMESSHKQAVMRTARERELYHHVAQIVNFGVGQHWKDDDKDALKRYADIQHELRMHLLESGFCLHCEAFPCECDESDF